MKLFEVYFSPNYFFFFRDKQYQIQIFQFWSFFYVSDIEFSMPVLDNKKRKSAESLLELEKENQEITDKYVIECTTLFIYKYLTTATSVLYNFSTLKLYFKGEASLTFSIIKLNS